MITSSGGPSEGLPVTDDESEARTVSNEDLIALRGKVWIPLLPLGLGSPLYVS